MSFDKVIFDEVIFDEVVFNEVIFDKVTFDEVINFQAAVDISRKLRYFLGGWLYMLPNGLSQFDYIY